MADQPPLDAYSQVVAGVAAHLTGKVASLRVPVSGSRDRGPRRGGESLGSAVVYTSDGFLLTNAHVVAGSERGSAEFADGTVAAVRVVGSDPLSDLAVLAADRDLPGFVWHELDRSSRAATCGAASERLSQPA